MRRFILMVMSLGFITPSWAADTPAILQWSQRVELSMPVSGVVQVVYANAGERVKKGQALLLLDAGTYQASVTEAQAEWARHKEETLDAQRNMDRVQELYNRTVIATSELEQAQTRLARAKATMNESQARLTNKQKTLGDATLRAPFDALVIARAVEPGQTVASQFQPQTLFILARANEMIARAKVSLAQIEKLKMGDTLTVHVNQQSYQGKIKMLGLESVGEKSEAGYWLDVLISAKETLRAGVPARVTLP